MKKVALVLSVLCLAFVITACSSSNNSSGDTKVTPTIALSEDDYEEVCTIDNKVERAAAYEKIAGTVSPVYITKQSDVGKDYISDNSTFPDEWKVDYTNLDKAQLVACIKVSDRVEAKTCDFESNGEPLVLKIYNAKYTVTLKEAKNGQIVDQQEFNLESDPNCPYVHYFIGSTSETNPDYEQVVTEFLKPYIQH